MKRSFSAGFGLLLGLCGPGAGEEGPQPSHLRIVNAAAVGEVPVRVEVNGYLTWRLGYLEGESSGWIHFPSGTHEVVMRAEGFEDGAGRAVLEPAKGTTLVMWMKRTEKDDGEVENELQVWSREPEEGVAPMELELVGMVPGEVPATLQVRIGRQKRDVALGWQEVRRFPLLGEGGSIAVRGADGSELVKVRTESKGRYVVVVFPGADGKPRATSYFEPGR